MTSMTDVAKAAGVSIATVSRVLAGKPGVRPETAERIRAAAADLDYTYNSLAASLRRQRTMLVGICVPQVTNPFFAALIEGLENAVASLGFDVLVADAQEDAEIELARVGSLVERQIDGLVLVPTGNADLARSIPDALPCVVVDRELPGFDADWVGVDHRAGIGQVIEHLHARGHRHLGYLGAGTTNTAAAERATAFHDIAGGPALEGDFSIEWGRDGAARLRAAHPEVTAFVCANDLIAFGAMGWAREAGIAMPDGIAITGFDDLSFAALVDPGLTTVRQPLEQITAAVARSLGRVLAPDVDADAGAPGRRAAPTPSRELIPGTLVTRGST